MERISELRERLGSENVDLLLREAKDGNWKKTKIKLIAIKMKANGVFNEKEHSETLENVLRYVLDKWFDNVLEEDPEEDLLRALVAILEDGDIGLKALARKMKMGNEKIGLPKEHFIIPGFTAAPAVVSQQGNKPVCASHSVAKAIVEIFDDYGYDCNQDKATNALLQAVQSDGKPRNPDEFDNKVILVEINKKGDTSIIRMKIHVKVQTEWAPAGNNYTFNMIPTLQEEDLKKYQRKMVVRWAVHIPSEKVHAVHAIYARRYDAATGVYSCVNQHSLPEIHNSVIHAVDYISIKKY